MYRIYTNHENGLFFVTLKYIVNVFIFNNVTRCNNCNFLMQASIVAYEKKNKFSKITQLKWWNIEYVEKVKKRKMLHV